MVTDRRVEATGLLLDPSLAVAYPDIAGLFEQLADAIAGKSAVVRADYDFSLGYPTSAWIDVAVNAADDEHGFTVGSFVVEP